MGHHEGKKRRYVIETRGKAKKNNNNNKKFQTLAMTTLRCSLGF